MYTDLMQNEYTIIVGVTRHPPPGWKDASPVMRKSNDSLRGWSFLIWLGDVTMSVYTIQYNTSVTTATYTLNIHSYFLAPASNKIPI